MSIRKIDGSVIDADTLDGVQEATLATEAELATAVSDHAGVADAHHTPTTPATKEFFAPVLQGTELTQDFDHPGALIDAAGEYAWIEFDTPHDFTSIVEAVVVRTAIATALHRLNYQARYGALGENVSIHNENIVDQDTDETDNLVYEQDVSAMLTSLAAGDYVAIKVSADPTNVPNNHILGLRFKYS